MLVAIVAIEDDRFWQHGALDVKGTIRALVNDLEHKPIQGGSTLEQQYVKNVLILQALDDPAAQQAASADNLSRKLDQLRMAVQIAHTMTKQEILAGYLNDSYYGSGAWGIEAAAETYFNTTAAKLTLSRPPRWPASWRTRRGTTRSTNPDLRSQRRNTVLARIAQTNPSALKPADATVLEAAEARAAPGAEQSGCTASTVGKARLLLRLRDAHAAARPAARRHHQDRAKLLATGGLKIYTTLSPTGPGRGDPRGQLRAARELQDLQPAHNAATEVLIQPGTGKILAIAKDRPYGTGLRADRGRLRGQHAVRRRRRRADRFVVQAVHPDHRARAGRAFRLPAHGARLRLGQRLLRLRGQPVGTIAGSTSPACSTCQLRGPRHDHRLPVHRHHRLHQRLLRPP